MHYEFVKDETLQDAEQQALLITRVEKAMRTAFPWGHIKFIPMLLAEAQLHSAKNYDYASGGDPLGNFARVSKILAMYPALDLAQPEVVAAVYMMKQLDQVLWSLSRGQDGKIEGIGERLADVSVYAKLMAILHTK